MIQLSAYVAMGQLHVTAAHWGRQEDGRTLVTNLGGGVVDLDPAASDAEQDLLALTCEVGLDIAHDTWAVREPF